MADERGKPREQPGEEETSKHKGKVVRPIGEHERDRRGCWIKIERPEWMGEESDRELNPVGKCNGQDGNKKGR